MRLATFLDQSARSRIGASTADGRIVDLNAACKLYLREHENDPAYSHIADARVPPDMRLLFEGGDRSLDAARAALDYVTSQNPENGVDGEPIFFRREDIRLKAPIIPKKFFHTAGNFREHHHEAEKAGFSHPVLPWIVFFQNVDAIIGPDEPVIFPPHLTQELDYELELAVVVKKAGKHFDAKTALDYIGGFVIFNDITARDIQRNEMKSGVFSLCKGIDSFCPLGPHIVTADEIKDPHKLQIKLTNNGTVYQNFNTDDMAHKIPRCIEWVTSIHTLEPGDILATGTNHRGLNPFMDGDKIELTCEGCGTLHIKVRDPLKRSWARITRLQHKQSGAEGVHTKQTGGKYAK